MSIKLVVTDLLKLLKHVFSKPQETQTVETPASTAPQTTEPVLTVEPPEPVKQDVLEKSDVVTAVVTEEPKTVDRKPDPKTTSIAVKQEVKPAVPAAAEAPQSVAAKEKSVVTVAVAINKIVTVAESYIGKTEKPNNSGFTDAAFERKMKEVGWSTSLSWCSYFAELVVTEAFKELGMRGNAHIMGKLFSGSATATWKNFELDGTYKTGKAPKPGSLAVWRYGNSWQGHIGVVVAADPATGVFKCVEGNTNDKGGREGYIVAKKTRKTGLPYNAKGLNLIGFIYLV